MPLKHFLLRFNTNDTRQIYIQLLLKMISKKRTTKNLWILWTNIFVLVSFFLLCAVKVVAKSQYLTWIGLNLIPNPWTATTTDTRGSFTHRLIARNLMPDIFRSNISKEWRWQENHSDVRYEHHKHKERRRNDYCWFIRSFEHCQRYFDFWLVLLTLEKPSEKMMSFCLEM